METGGPPLVVCRLSTGEPIPAWAVAGEWWSISRSPGELSIICEESLVPPGVAHGGRWTALRVEGPLDHELIGVLAALAEPLANAHIPIFAISTHDTDWVLVPEHQLEQAVAALQAAGHCLNPSPPVES
ncbi:MAG: ACT domain-containing protein [Candidatus Dormiibacterota bacterium]|jgi:hypothetical protein